MEPVLRGLIVFFLAGSIAAGLGGLVHPLAGAGIESSLDALLAVPGLWEATALSLWSGLASTALALVLALAISGVMQRSRAARLMRRTMPLLIATPHITLAIGLAFLVAPSGWLVRLVSPWATGWTVPPMPLQGSGEWAGALILGLVVKETPFLLLMIEAAAGQIDPRQDRVAASLGYSPFESWIKIVVPQIYRQLRLPLLTVLVFALTNVEMAAVLGPSRPPTLAVLALARLQDADPAIRDGAAAVALLLTLLALAAVLAWYGLERLVARVTRAWLVGGRSRLWPRHGEAGARLAALALILFSVPSIVVLAIWSLAGRWRFPDALPATLNLKVWANAAGPLLSSTGTTLALGIATSVLAMAISILWLECRNRERGSPHALWLYLPLLVPQIGFLFGLQHLQIMLGLDPGLTGLVWMHLVYVLPYTALVLRDPWLALDPRYARTARSLGHSRMSVLLRVKLPLLRLPLAIAFGVGFSVSAALYLPTLFGGGGRYETLALEALALAYGGDRRLAAAYGLVLAILPFLMLLGARRLGRWRRFDGSTA